MPGGTLVYSPRKIKFSVTDTIMRWSMTRIMHCMFRLTLVKCLLILAVTVPAPVSFASEPPGSKPNDTGSPPVLSIEQLEKSYALFPYDEKTRHALATAYADKGQDLLKLKQYDEAVLRFEQARTLNPEVPDYGVLKGIALYLGKRYDEAAYELERSRQAVGDNVSILFYLGKVRYDSGDLPAALDVWELALVLDPTNRPLQSMVEKARKEMRVESGMEKGYRSMFVISYDEGTMSDLADEVLKTLESAYNRVGSDLNYYPSVRVPVILYTRKDYRSVTSGPEWSGGLYDGKVRLPIGGAVEINPMLRGVLTHEYTHVVIRELAKGNCPSWLNEGVAEVEGRTEFNLPLTSLAAAAKSGTFLSFTSLEGSLLGFEGTEVRLAYEQSYSMVMYLVATYGWYKVKDLLEALGTGRDIAAAIAEVFADLGLDYTGLVREWRESVQREYRN
jgi:Peptidase MA superfamily/Tetratricopeptide repeat